MLPSPTLADGLAPIVQTLNSAIHRTNIFSADMYLENREFQLRYPLDRDLSNG